MKDDKFTVIPQNMRAYEISIREADIDNDEYRKAFEQTIADDPLPLTSEDYLLAEDFFKAGWEAAVRVLNDDPPEMTEEDLESQYMSYLEAGGFGEPLSFEQWKNKR